MARIFVTIDLDDEVWEIVKAAAPGGGRVARGVDRLPPRAGDQPRFPPRGQYGTRVGCRGRKDHLRAGQISHRLRFPRRTRHPGCACWSCCNCAMTSSIAVPDAMTAIGFGAGG
jgi:hypothetical protein